MIHTSTRGLAFTFIALLAAAFCGGCDDPRELQVRLAFDNFAKACANSQGEPATAALCESSHLYYSRIKDLALVATRQQLRAKTQSETVETLTVRALIPPNDLRKMDGRAVFAALATAGAFVSMADVVPKAATFQGKSTAQLRVKLGEEPVPAVVEMRLENGQWRVDYQSADRDMEQRINKAAKKGRVGEDAVIERLVESAVQQEFDPLWWNPPPPK